MNFNKEMVSELIRTTNIHFHTLSRYQDDLKNICYRGKGGEQPNNEPEYGYYISSPYVIIRVAELVEQLNIRNIIDLGCGAGIAMSVLRILCGRQRGINTYGIDNEPVLIKYAQHLMSSAWVGDLLKLQRPALEGMHAIYFWEPMRTKEHGDLFVDALMGAVIPGQYIIYCSSGGIGTSLLRYKNKLAKVKGVEYDSDNGDRYALKDALLNLYQVK